MTTGKGLLKEFESPYDSLRIIAVYPMQSIFLIEA